LKLTKTTIVETLHPHRHLPIFQFGTNIALDAVALLPGRPATLGRLLMWAAFLSDEQPKS
jgi:hypothetical protein